MDRSKAMNALDDFLCNQLGEAIDAFSSFCISRLSLPLVIP
jgi:hypothetical protein